MSRPKGRAQTRAPSATAPPFEPDPFRSAIRSHSSRATIRAMVEKQIADVKLNMLLMMTRRNALVPISILPPELLARIFSLLTLEHPPFKDRKQNLGWIVVTHVCRHWRQVALDDASLWGKLDGFQPSSRWITEMVVRSKGAPLDISFMETPSQQALSLFSQNFSRIRELALSAIWTESAQKHVQNMLGCEAPTMERLIVGFLGGSHHPRPNTLTFLKGHAPRLRELSLCNVALPWSSFPSSPLTLLTVVSLDKAAQKASALDSLDTLFDVMENSPSLDSLILRDCLPSTPSTAPHTRTVNLPKLSFISLAGPRIDVVRIFGAVRLPPSARIALECTSPPPVEGDPGHVVSLIAAHFGSPGSVTFRSLDLMLNGTKHSFEISATNKLPESGKPPSSIFQDPESDEIDLHLIIETHHDSNKLSSLVQRTLASLSLADIECIAFTSSSEPVITLDWKQILRQGDKITSVEVLGGGTVALLQAINPPKQTIATTSSSNPKARGQGKNTRGSQDPPQQTMPMAVNPPPFRELKSLFFELLAFSRKVPGASTVYDLVRSIVDRRRKCGVPIKILDITSCTISDNQVRSLKTLVGKLQWDGDDGGHSQHALLHTHHYHRDFDDDSLDGYTDGDTLWEQFLMGRSGAERAWLEDLSD
ncbi:hypothetical protein BC834DRAFT_320865 [Gloeopeniophorella convolvens]|nr:hypothetical protein BC834DRAFT_320865 [Gloeopeniophorella convolvens]